MPGPPPHSREMLPERLLPILYFAAAHVALALAFGLAALSPAEIGGFYYHPRLIAVVHLVTLGWISLSILGAIYIVGPLALRMPMPAGRIDYLAWGILVIGISGMFSHFLLERWTGLAWSAAMVLAGILPAAGRVAAGLPVARIPAAVKAHVVFAFFALLLAASAGLIMGINRAVSFLPVRPIDLAIAHGHLAALGWATMMVVGAGYRLLPMVLPSAMPSEKTLWASFVLLGAGSLGLFVTMAARSGGPAIFAALCCAGLFAFMGNVVGMLRRSRPAPGDLPMPDFASLHVGAAFLWLLAAQIAGMTLAIVPQSEWSLRAASIYGLLGLVGFLSQMVVGIGGRILPMFAVIHAVRRAPGGGVFGPGGSVDPDPPVAHRLPSRRLQAVVFTAWASGMPLLAGGLLAGWDRLVSLGAWILLCGVVAGGIGNWRVLRHAFPRRRARGGSQRGFMRGDRADR